MNQEQALSAIQAQMTSPDWVWLMDEYVKLLADTPKDDIERECDNVGHCLMLTLKRTAPQMSEATAYGLPYAFSRLLLQRLELAA
jgi:hypothetical protein